MCWPLVRLVRQMIDRDSVLSGVSRETGSALEKLVGELLRWQHVKNLVSHTTLSEVWHRHIADSLQLLPICRDTGSWVDLGSGGGFPGLVVAIQRTEAQLGTTHLVESNHRKCAFLLHCIRLLKLDARVHACRIEDFQTNSVERAVVVSARALAPLDQLIAWSIGLLRNGAIGIFPKGQDVERELRDAAISWDFAAVLHPSQTDPNARIVTLRMGTDKELSDVR
jgi:16S rRNA (guanine527-N7)-methyltransferase